MIISLPKPLQQALLSLGFTDKEAGVYLGLLELGKGTVSQIARKAGINRTTGYDILDSLVSKDLASVSGKEPKQEYVAESPDKIVALLKNELNKNKLKLENAQNLIPELKSIHNQADRPKVRFYEGTEGLKEVYENTLTSHEPIRAYATFDDMANSLPGYFPDYFYRRAQKGIAIRGIFPQTASGAELATHDKEQLRETAFIPADKFYFTPEINIYDNKVMIASWREKLGIIIESQEIADAMKKIYELSWAQAKHLEKKNVPEGKKAKIKRA